MIYERSNTPVDPGVLERVMERLKHRGPDGHDVYFAGHVAMGHWHFWTTPEEVGERQPLEVNGLPFRVILDGRIDNRTELFEQLDIHPAEGNHLSDAALILHCYSRWGRDCFSRFVGEYALVILDEILGQVVCARDAIGTRTLYYAWQGTQLVVASEAWAVAGAFPSTPELNQKAAALFFVFQVQEDGESLFKNVYTLLPGHYLLVSDSIQTLSHYWQPDPSKKLRYKTDEEYAGHFLSLLEKSVECRMRSTTPVGVLMSGGLDSTSVACLAARMIAPRQLTTISYVFDEFADCDERQYIDKVTAEYNTRSIQIPCDDLYPFHNWPDWPINPNYPAANVYAAIRERAHKRAHQEGIRVLLTGDFGDDLYGAAGDWLTDLLSDGKFGVAGREVIHHFGGGDSKRKLIKTSFRRVARHILDGLPLGKRLRRGLQPPGWLTPFAAQILSMITEQQAPVPDRVKYLMGLRAAESSAMGTVFTSKDELELRFPYRDRRLVEFILAIPAYQLYQRGISRTVLRNAMRGILPDPIRTRVGKTGLMPLFFYSLEHNENELAMFFSAQFSNWKNYVKQDWVMGRWQTLFTPDQSRGDKVVPWLCVAFERWYKYVEAYS